MNEKLSFQNISEALVQSRGVTKKVADTFAKAFFDTIVEALYMGEDSIKVKGLGTFKLVSVDSRESVNVSNGERIVIPGYKKVSFTPEDSVVEVLNAYRESEVHTEITENAEGLNAHIKSEGEEAPTEKAETEGTPAEIESGSEISVKDKDVVSERVDGVSEGEEGDEIDTLVQVPEPDDVETPQDAFAGIDLLISTPESVEDIRLQYEEAKTRMETAVEEARKANAEKMRLERLLERLEKNVEPEEKTHMESEVLVHTEEKEIPTSDHEAPETPVQDKNLVSEKDDETKRREAFNRVMVEQPKMEEEPRKKGRKGWVIALICLFLAAIIFFIVKTFFNIEAVEDVQVAEQTVKPIKPIKPSARKVHKDSLQLSAQKEDSIKKAVADSLKNNVKPSDATELSDKKRQSEDVQARPSTHKIKPGESLTRISQKYYGTKDSVRAILRVNTFNDPDNIPVGAVVKLP